MSEKGLTHKEDDAPPHVGWRHRKRHCASWHSTLGKPTCAYKLQATRSPAAGRARATPPAGCWLLGALEEAGRRCANTMRGARERRKNAFTARDSAMTMTSRPTQRNTKEIYARPGTEPTQRTRNHRTPGAAAARLLPVAAAVAISPRVIHAVSPRAVRAIFPRAVRAVPLRAISPCATETHANTKWRYSAQAQ